MANVIFDASNCNGTLYTGKFKIYIKPQISAVGYPYLSITFNREVPRWSSVVGTDHHSDIIATHHYKLTDQY